MKFVFSDFQDIFGFCKRYSMILKNIPILNIFLMKFEFSYFRDIFGACKPLSMILKNIPIFSIFVMNLEFLQEIQKIGFRNRKIRKFECGLRISDVGIQTLDFGIQIRIWKSKFGLRTSDFGVHISDIGFENPAVRIFQDSKSAVRILISNIAFANSKSGLRSSQFGLWTLIPNPQFKNVMGLLLWSRNWLED